MKILDHICSGCIVSDLSAESKDDILASLVRRAVDVEPGLDEDVVLSVLKEREQLGSTGIGGGVAIPHGKLHDLSHMLIVVGRIPGGVLFDAVDSSPVHIVFLLLAPHNSSTMYLKILAGVSRLLKTQGVYERIMEAPDEQAIREVIEEMDTLV